ncbi:MAG TPA: rubrerythrin family protein [Kofleriaceae bacterium]
MAALVLWPFTSFAQPAASPQRTIDNLNAAIQGEANASHRYKLFAEQADREGNPQVAKLFRATALAESIHEKDDEAVLRAMGLEPRPPVIENVIVGTTRENLEAPIKAERNEEEKTYPAMIAEARREHVPAAAKSFAYAMNTEAEHARLFANALANLGHNPPVDYYVGTVSGDTVTKPTGREPYTKVE